MYRHKIPIHLDQQDHFIAGLNARQILILGSGLSIGYMLFSDLAALSPSMWAMTLGIVLGVFMAALALLVAFFQWKGRGLEQWAVVLLLYLASPKVLLWKEREEEEDELEPPATTSKSTTHASNRQKGDDEW